MEDFNVKQEQEQNFLAILPNDTAEASNKKTKFRLGISSKQFEVVEVYGSYNVCSKCNKFFQGDKSLCKSCRNERDRNYRINRGKHFCDFCCVKVQRFYDHFLRFAQECLICHEKNKCKVAKEKHYDGHRNSLGEFNCTHLECTKTYKTCSQLQFHVGQYHQDASRRTCKICSKTLTTASGMKLHIKQVHQGSKSLKRFSCDLCPVRARSKGNLKIHMETHKQNPDKRFTCDKCDSKFTYKSSVQSHLKGSFKKCWFCDEKFRCKKLLDEHLIEKHANEKNVWQCKTCCKVFKSKNELKVHQNLTRHGKFASVKPEDIVECSLCSKLFKNKFYLTIHMKRIHGMG